MARNLSAKQKAFLADLVGAYQRHHLMMRDHSARIEKLRERRGHIELVIERETERRRPATGYVAPDYPAVGFHVPPPPPAKPFDFGGWRTEQQSELERVNGMIRAEQETVNRLNSEIAPTGRLLTRVFEFVDGSIGLSADAMYERVLS